MQTTTHTPEQTIRLGKKLAQTLRPGDIICLHGELGAGKTTLVKGIAAGLGVKDQIVSPTFTLMNIYQMQNAECRMQNFVHIDTYRLKNEQELIEIGVEDYLGNPETVCIIEWPEKIQRLLKSKKTIDVMMLHSGNEERRIVIR